MSMVLMRSLLITGLLSGLVINYPSQKVLGVENPSSPILILAEADSSTISIKDLSQKANELDVEMDQLNLKLKQVVSKEIDRLDIDFNRSKDILKKFKEQWEQWKQSLTEEQTKLLQEKIDKTDQYLTRIEGVINPLKAEIIPTQEQFKASPETPLTPNQELKTYQQNLFGENANPSDTDGIFGSGTQTKIESILNESVESIKTKLSEINGVVVPSKNNSQEPKDNSDDLKAENQRLKAENQRLKIENQKLKLQQTPKTPNSPIPPISPSPPFSPLVTNNPETTQALPETRNLSFLILPILLGILGVIVLGIYRQSQMSKTMKRSVSKYKTQLGNNSISKTSIIKSDDFNENEEDQTQHLFLSPQSHSHPYHSLNAYDTEGIGEVRNPSSSENRGNKQIQTTQESVIIDLSSIDNKEDLVKIYNNNRQVFEQEMRNPQIIEIVAVDKESIEDQRLGLDNDIIFTPDLAGSYFIFRNFALDKYYYYLLPKPKLIVNSFNYKTLNAIFQCDNYEQKHSNEFILKQAAIVAWTHEGIWLNQPGLIYFK